MKSNLWRKKGKFKFLANPGWHLLYPGFDFQMIGIFLFASRVKTTWCPSSSHCPLPLLVSICLFSGSVSLFLFCRQDHVYHFSRFHIYALIYDICFALSDLFHSVWQFLGPSTSLQMIQFYSFLWLSNIPLYVCVCVYTHTIDTMCKLDS